MHVYNTFSIFKHFQNFQFDMDITFERLCRTVHLPRLYCAVTKVLESDVTAAAVLVVVYLKFPCALMHCMPMPFVVDFICRLVGRFVVLCCVVGQTERIRFI